MDARTMPEEYQTADELSDSAESQTVPEVDAEPKLELAELEALIESKLETPEPEPEPLAEAMPEDWPEYFHVVSDNQGFVGAFFTLNGVREHVLDRFSLTPFVVQRFAVADCPIDRIWVVLYRDLDAVAFVSNSRDEAERRQEALGSIGLTYPDSIDYWEHPVGTIAKAPYARLSALHRAHEMYAGVAVAEERQQCEKARLARLERLERVLQPELDGPIARLLREEERITIFDCVIPVDAHGASAPDG